MSRPFLTARWANLVLLTFEAPETLVRAHIHPALEPDRWDGRTHVNLVALSFDDIRVRGWRLPGLKTFPQVNLRTFVRLDGVPGVSFIRELVPNRLVAAVSRLRYNQSYGTLPIRQRVSTAPEEVRVEYALGPGARWHIAVAGSQAATVPPETTLEHYCKERFWGFGSTRRGELIRFRVEHPRWAVREVRRLDYDLDFAALYGAEWGFLNGTRPVSVILAVGSEVAVYEPLVASH